MNRCLTFYKKMYLLDTKTQCNSKYFRCNVHSKWYTLNS